jgi:hypothetical protein
MDRRRCLRGLGAACCVMPLLTGAGRAERPAQLAPFEFLLGDWEAVGDQAGATGGFTFAPAVQDRVIVRTNYSNTPASGGTAASRHDDVMTIYVEASIVRADYFDNEGHVIRYVAQTREGEVRLLSEIKPSEPRYRLTYTKGSATIVKGTFEVAPPGQPEAFAPYLSWTARRVAAPQPAATDPLQPLAFLIGRWEGASEGQPGAAKVQREYLRILNSRFIRGQNRSVYPPQEKNPKGETHEDLGVFSFDTTRRKAILHQFHVEGFVNQYVSDLTPQDGKLVFTSEAIENIPPGWRARESYTVLSPDAFEEVFELSEPGKPFEVYSRARFKRVP